jgi:hypothetical protein
MFWFRTPHLPTSDWFRTLLFANNFVDRQLVSDEDPTVENITAVGYACNSFTCFCRAAGYDPQTPQDVAAAAHGLVFGELTRRDDGQ